MSELINCLEIFDEIPNKLKKVIKSLYVFDDNKANNVLFVTLNDKVFGFGSNDWGVCGFGHQMVVNEPKIIEELCDKSVIQFYNGCGFAFALTSDNKLYGWGSNEDGQLGIKVINDSKIYKPVLIEDIINITIKQISCGAFHTLVLTSDGMVYGWGWNGVGQIGCEKELGEKISVITQLKTLKNIKAIHCLFKASFALTDNGMVYSWGLNRCYDLGHELKQNEWFFEPQLIINLLNITSICSSYFNTYFLSNEGNIYYCGVYYDENNYQCFQKSPQIILKQRNIISLYAVKCYQKGYPIGCALSEECVYSLRYNEIHKTNYRNIEEFFTNEYRLTFNTYYVRLLSETQKINIKKNGKNVLICKIIINNLVPIFLKKNSQKIFGIRIRRK